MQRQTLIYFARMYQAGCSVILLLMLSLSVAQAQIIIEGGAVMGLPANDFKETSPSVLGIGFNGSVLYRPGYSVLGIGGNVGYMLYGRDTRDEEVLLDDGTIVDGQLINNSSMVQLHVIGRFEPNPEGGFPVLPYAEGLLGTNFVYTNSKVKVEYQDEALAQDNKAFHMTWSIGWAAGVNVNLSEQVLLDFKFKYLKTGQVKYLTSKDVSYDPVSRSLVVQKRKSTVDMYMPHIGLTFFVD